MKKTAAEPKAGVLKKKAEKKGLLKGKAARLEGRAEERKDNTAKNFARAKKKIQKRRSENGKETE